MLQIRNQTVDSVCIFISFQNHKQACFSHKMKNHTCWYGFLSVVEPGRLLSVFSSCFSFVNRNLPFALQTNVLKQKIPLKQASRNFLVSIHNRDFCLIVEPGRFELPSKRAVVELSTCVVFVKVFVCLPVENNQRTT